jgi:uncharacterized membrane protein
MNTMKSQKPFVILVAVVTFVAGVSLVTRECRPASVVETTIAPMTVKCLL